MTITYCRYLCIVALLLCTIPGQTQQPDTLFLTGTETKINLLPHLKFVTSPENLPPEVALNLITQQSFSLTEATIGFTRDVYWGALIVKNNSSTPISYLLELENPQIDSLHTYTYSADRVTPWILTGDKFPFTKRALPHRNFIFPIKLNTGESKALLLKIDKRNSSVNFPLNLWKDTYFYEKDYLANLGYGLYFGLTALCALYSILIFGFLRSSIYLWYFIWIISSAIFVSTGLGFSHQFLYPHADDANSIFRVIIQVINQKLVMPFIT
jgi:hypothetical protein